MLGVETNNSHGRIPVQADRSDHVLQKARRWRWSIQATKRAWTRTGLDMPLLLRMMKAGLPPVIVVAIYQSSAVSDITLTFGYITAIMATISQCLLPRAKFIKIMFFILLSTCVSASISCLAVVCSVKARGHGATSTEVYNSNACVVSGIFLLFMIWVSNSLRAYKPMELQDPMVAFSIFAIISLTQSCQVLSIQEGLHSVKELLCTFMIGFAIATGVSLFILPLTSRKNVFGGFRAYPTAITKVLESFKAYLDSLRQSSDSGSDNQTTDTSQTILDRQVTENSKTAAVTAALQSLQGLHDKLHAELFYASREVAWGKLDATDIKVIIAHLRPILLSVAGIVMSTPLIDKSTSGKTLSGSLLGGSDLGTGQSRPMSCFWKRYLESLDQNITTVTELANLGMQHSFTVLGVLSKKVASANNDLEANPNAIKPGQRDFADHLKVRIKHFSSRHGCTENLFTTSCSQRPPSYRCKCDETTCSSPTKEELLVALSLENLEDTALAAVHDLVNLAEQMEQAGKMQRARLILPGAAQLIAWLSFNTLYSGTTSQNHDSVEEEPDDPDARHLEELSDPEHLPASSTWQRLGNRLRSLSHMMSSDQSVLGFRAACASFTVGILAYLHQTQHFFTEQRLVWAMIVVVLGMSPSTGASVFSFIWRLIGTVVALVLSLVVYYIADGKTAGVIVFLYIANCFMQYFYIKFPHILGPVIISTVTLNLIVAYELQVKKLGIEESTSTGQPYYPIYLFGPYKLATVAAGCLICFFWTIFPYPILTSSQVRKLLGRSLFNLAQFYGYMHTTIDTWMVGGQNDAARRSTLRSLQSARKALFAEQMSMLPALRKQIAFTKYEATIGGRFPGATYSAVVNEIQCITFGMAVMAHLGTGSHTHVSGICREDEETSHGDWLQQLALLTKSTDFNSHRTTSLLCHLSAAISNQTALPPFTTPLDPFPIAKSLEKLDQEMLDIKNITDPAFRAFASMEVMSSIVNQNLKSLTRNVISLVGELNFDITKPEGVKRS